MKRLHILGRKNHGKTQLVIELVQALSSRGLRVGTVKHTHHQHELDTPGKDSHRHRTAGAAVVGILSPAMSAVFLPMSADMSSKHDRYRALAPLFESCDLVLVEGDSATNAPKIEVWRSVLGKEPLAANDESILATVSDDAPLVKCSVYPRSDVSALAEWVLNTVIKTRID